MSRDIGTNHHSPSNNILCTIGEFGAENGTFAVNHDLSIVLKIKKRTIITTTKPMMITGPDTDTILFLSFCDYFFTIFPALRREVLEIGTL
jgi:hypothetical protein